MESVVKVFAQYSAKWRPGDSFRFALFSCFIDLKMNTTTTIATPMVSFGLVFLKLSEEVTFVTFIKGNKVFDFWWFLVKNLKTMNHL